MPSDIASSPAAAQRSPALEMDLARGQAVYVNESGVRSYIQADDPDGTLMKCVSASGLVIEDPANGKGIGAMAAMVRAIIIGVRSDGTPGMWTVLTNGTIQPIVDDSDGRITSQLPECVERDGSLRGKFGWKYYVTGISEDSRIVVGYIKNEKGFSNGKWTVDPNTTIGVYWKVSRRAHHPYVSVGRARVIGVLDASKLPQKNGRWQRWIDRLARGPWVSLRLYLSGYYSAYLIMADSVSYDSSKKLYSVPGTDQDNQKAIATIDKSDNIVITPVVTPTDLPDLTVTDVQGSVASQSTITENGVQVTSVQWTLGATVQNTGVGPAAATTVQFRISLDTTLDSTDAFIGSMDVPGLAAGESFTNSLSATSSVAEGGPHYVFANVNPAGTGHIAESNESNNSMYSRMQVSILYPRIIIDTYRPAVESSANTHTSISLFGPDGENSAAIPGNPVVNQSWPSFARVEYTGGLAPGTYYIRVKDVDPAEEGAYAIRVVTSIQAPPNEYPAAENWYYTTIDTSDPYESGDTLVSGVPNSNVVSISLGAKLDRNRYLGPGEVDWCKLVLP
jgi:hypothetical protein